MRKELSTGNVRLVDYISITKNLGSDGFNNIEVSDSCEKDQLCRHRVIELIKLMFISDNSKK